MFTVIEKIPKVTLVAKKSIEATLPRRRAAKIKKLHPQKKTLPLAGVSARASRNEKIAGGRERAQTAGAQTARGAPRAAGGGYKTALSGPAARAPRGHSAP